MAKSPQAPLPDTRGVSAKESGGQKPRLRSIREIADAAGVSTATVSRVINNPGSVKAERRQRVQDVIDRNDFVNDGVAQSLKGGRSRTIGLVIPSITNSIYAASTQAIQRFAQQQRYSVILVVSDFEPEEEKILIRRLVERRVDGIILTGGEHHPSIYRLLERHNIPCVLTWRMADNSTMTCVSFDNYHAGLMAMKRLTELGHIRIGLICGRPAVNDRAEKRRRAYEDALMGISVAIDPELIFERDFEFSEGRDAMAQMLTLPSPPTAVFAANDIQAIGAIDACHAAGLRIPDDISIIGFDDLPIAEFCVPKLTTIRVPAVRMGNQAAIKLFQKIDGETTVDQEVLPVTLVERETTGPVRFVNK